MPENSPKDAHPESEMAVAAQNPLKFIIHRFTPERDMNECMSLFSGALYLKHIEELRKHHRIYVTSVIKPLQSTPKRPNNISPPQSKTSIMV